MRFYAEKMPDGTTSICTVSRSQQLHLTEPKPTTWGYFEKVEQAEYAIQHDVWPSELEKIMGVEEAAELWGLAPGTIKNLCAAGKITSRKIGKTWVISKDHPNPKNKKEEE